VVGPLVVKRWSLVLMCKPVFDLAQGMTDERKFLLRADLFILGDPPLVDWFKFGSCRLSCCVFASSSF